MAANDSSGETTVTACRAEPGHNLWLRFADGIEGRVFLGNLIGIGAFTMWRYPGQFEKVRVGDGGRTVVWDAGIRLDGEILHFELTTRPADCTQAAASDVFLEFAAKFGRRADHDFQRFMTRVLEKPTRARRKPRRG